MAVRKSIFRPAFDHDAALALLRMRPDEPGVISFDPPLTAKAGAFARREVGHVMKVIMHFRERFWEDPRVVGETVAFGFSLCLDAAFPTFWTNQAFLENVLVGWAGGPPAEKLIGHTPAEIRAAAIISVSKTFGISAAKVGSQLVRIRFPTGSPTLLRSVLTAIPVLSISELRKSSPNLSTERFSSPAKQPMIKAQTAPSTARSRAATVQHASCWQRSNAQILEDKGE